jgi:uncharacterized protein YkwD
MLRRASLASLLVISVLFTACGEETQTPPELTPRQKANKLYFDEYIASEVGYGDIGWTGSVSGCVPGEIPQEIHDKVAQRVNYYRTMAGLGSISLEEERNRYAQEAALLMRANNSLSHNPPQTWTCWTQDGYTGASRSNLSYGSHTVNAVDGQMRDAGSNNTRVGHRRWILYSKATLFGHGSTDRTQALYVLGNMGGATGPMRDEYIAWPPRGYVPNRFIWPRWSVGIPGADFRSSEVKMKYDQGADIPVKIISQGENGYGDNTIAWEPQGLGTSVQEDTTIEVTVTKIDIKGTDKTITYKVVAFQPEDPTAPDAGL